MILRCIILRMSNNYNKNKYGMTRKQEKDASKFFGKHISKVKTIYLLIVTLITCAMPMLVGLRLWDRIPDIVETGLIGTNGQDDSMPREVFLFMVFPDLCACST